MSYVFAGSAKPRRLLFIIISCLVLNTSLKAQDGEAVFAGARDQVFQILIIDTKSQEKAAIGSGFLLAGDGLIATNFHVISAAVHKPQKYRIELKTENGVSHALRLVDFDVVHDLAIVQLEDKIELPAPLSIAAQQPLQGEQIFSLGNPFDLGHTIVPGTFNGLLEKSFYQKLHFSGSLNPGMSGGPAINKNGHVVGINVATSGNQVSFLVPVKYLQRLLNNFRHRGAPLAATKLSEEVGNQLYADQQFKFDLLLNREWLTQPWGKMQVGADIDDFFKCWGDSSDEDEEFVSTVKNCTSQDSIFVSSSLDTGLIDLQYAWLETEEYGTLRFHKYFSSQFDHIVTRTYGNEDDLTNYQCNREFVTQAEVEPRIWRAVLCIRQYKDYPKLFDALFLSSLLGEDTEGLVSHFALSGVSRHNVEAFAKRFMELHSWDS